MAKNGKYHKRESVKKFKNIFYKPFKEAKDAWEVVILFIFLAVSISSAQPQAPHIVITKDPNLYDTSICFEYYDSENSRIYNLDRDLTETEIELLEDIDGVESVNQYFYKYKVFIKIGKMFYWSDIHPLILEILNTKEAEYCGD